MAKQSFEAYQIGGYSYRLGGTLKHIWVDGQWLSLELPHKLDFYSEKASHRIESPLGGCWICRNSDGSWTGRVEDQFGSVYLNGLREALDWLLYADKYDPEAQH